MSETDTDIEWVTITHPSHAEDGQTGRVPRSAFETLWKAKGWTIVEPAPQDQAATEAPAPAVKTGKES